MVVDLRVTGAEDFRAVARAVKQAGDKDLRRELYRGINRTVKPLTQDVKDQMPRFLPDRYAGELAKSLRVKTRTRAGANPAVFLTATAKTKKGKPRDLRSLNRGRLRHPLFGNRREWFDQSVRKDWWTHPLLQGAPRVREELVEVLRDIARRIARHG